MNYTQFECSFVRILSYRWRFGENRISQRVSVFYTEIPPLAPQSLYS